MKDNSRILFRIAFSLLFIVFLMTGCDIVSTSTESILEEPAPYDGLWRYSKIVPIHISNYQLTNTYLIEEGRFEYYECSYRLETHSVEFSRIYRGRIVQNDTQIAAFTEEIWDDQREEWYSMELFRQERIQVSLNAGNTLAEAEETWLDHGNFLLELSSDGLSLINVDNTDVVYEKINVQ